MDTQPIDTTDILARPREYAAKLETMRAALEAVTAQLAAVTAERDAARAEVARLTALAYIGEHNFPDLTWKFRCDELSAEISRLTAALNDITSEFDNAGRGRDNGMMLIARAALRGDTAPARAEAGE